MPCVINHELPYSAEDFIHRIGRTGRAGSTGDAIALVDASEKRLLDDIEKLMKRKLEIKPLPEGAPSQSRAPSNRHSSSRAGSSSSSSASSNSAAPVKMSDPFFYKPYEPTAVPQSAEDAKSEEKKVGIVPAKPTVGALLGGFKKK
jgi:superfamily II DNA/RNA helicase